MSLQETRKVKSSPYLTLALLVRNEAGRFLSQMLQQVAGFIDAAVIVDDASNENTPDQYREILAKTVVPVQLICNSKPGFDNEIRLRKQVWDLAVAGDPDWIIFWMRMKSLKNRPGPGFALCLMIRSGTSMHSGYTIWDASHYRDDLHWQAHKFYRPFLILYHPGFDYQLLELPLHCGRLPGNVNALPVTISQLRIKHLGWSRPEDRRRMYEFYLSKDPDGR